MAENVIAGEVLIEDRLVVGGADDLLLDPQELSGEIDVTRASRVRVLLPDAAGSYSLTLQAKALGKTVLVEAEAEGSTPQAVTVNVGGGRSYEFTADGEFLCLLTVVGDRYGTYQLVPAGVAAVSEGVIGGGGGGGGASYAVGDVRITPATLEAPWIDANAVHAVADHPELAALCTSFNTVGAPVGVDQAELTHGDTTVVYGGDYNGSMTIVSLRGVEDEECLLRSTDLVTWTRCTLPGAPRDKSRGPVWDGTYWISWCDDQAGGIYRSLDGIAWEFVTVSIFVGSPTIWVADGKIFYYENGGDELYMSTDHGSSWSAVGFGGVQVNFVKCVVRRNNGHLFAVAEPHDSETADDGRVVRSTDGGLNWTLLSQIPGFGGGDWHFNTFAYDESTDTFYLGPHNYSTNNRQILRSTDGCATWTAIPLFTSATQFHYVSFAKDGILFVRTNDSELFWTPDDGETWYEMDYSGLGSLSGAGWLMLAGDSVVFEAHLDGLPYLGYAPLAQGPSFRPADDIPRLPGSNVWIYADEV